MPNPFKAFVDEPKEMLDLGGFIVMIILVLGAISAAFEMQWFTDQLISSITGGFLLILIIPSATLIIFIIWFGNKARSV
jgi:hypothetical protein